jgi:serine/threonine-protein kinase
MSTHTGEPTPTPDGTSLVGQLVSGRYRIEKMLGEGGMGAVYLAEHTHMRKRVALKLLHAEMSKDAEVLARFRREAQAAARVEHPNVATATDFGQTEDGSFFLVLEYIEGTSLRDTLERGAVPVGRALHIARQIALALERAHGLGIVHRDLKPENVMLVHKGEDPDFVKVLDFGIAKVEPHATRDASQPLTRFGAILGTPEYMAPEQALGENVGPACDLYSLGVILYEILTGKHPFDASDRMAVLSMHIVAPVPPMSERNPNVSVPLVVEDIVRALLEKDAKARPTSARALVELIDGAAPPGILDIDSPSSSRVLGGEASLESRTSLPSDRQTGANPWNRGDSLAKTDLHLAPASREARSIGAGLNLTSIIARVREDPSRAALLAVATIGPILILTLIVGIVLARRSSDTGPDAGLNEAAGGSTTPAVARGPHATPEKIQAATAGGIGALEALAESYPADPAVLKAYARALADAGRYSDMLRTVRTLASTDKGAIDDALLDAVAVAAQRAETSDEAFALLEGPLGARGVDTLLELSNTKTASPAIRKRATTTLGRPDVRANASPATGVFLDLKASKTCTDRHELLERVGESGDARVLPTLKALKNPRGCGFMGMRDCWPCLRKDDALEAAIKAVEGRPNP